MAGSPAASAILLLLLVLLVLQTSALQWSSHTPNPFKYYTDFGIVFRRTDDACKLCVGPENCVDIESDKCNYYLETAKIMKDDSWEGPHVSDFKSVVEANSRLRADVDAMLHSMAESVYQQHQYKECIPFVSKYTDCHKENICLGCKTCDCDATGHWNCTLSAKCLPNALQVTLDHRALLMVLDNLRKEDINTNRVKREIKGLSKPNEKKLTHEYLSAWMYGVPLINTTNVDKYENAFDDGTTEAVNAKYTYSTSQEIPEPIYVDKYSDDKIYDSDEQQPTTENEKQFKFILHNPLYEFTGPNSVFDGNTNKLKRSAEFGEGDMDEAIKEVINSTNIVTDDVDIEEWLRESKLIFNQFNNWRYKHGGIYVLNSTKEPNDILKTIANWYNYVREINKTTPNYTEDIKNYHSASESSINDKSTSIYDMSEINEFVSKVFGNENKINNTNRTKLNSDVDVELISEITKKDKLVAANDIVNKEVNTPYDEQSFTFKRSIDTTTEKDNNAVNETNNTNLMQLNKEEITEWLNEQHPFNQTQKIMTYQTTAINTSNSTNHTDNSMIFTTTDYMLALKDVDEDVLINNRTYNRRKPPLDMKHTEKASIDYMYDEDNVPYEDDLMEEGVHNENDKWFEEDTFNSMNTTEAPEYLTTTEAIEAAITEVVIDLLESAKNKLKNKVNPEDFITENLELLKIENSNTIDGESSNLPANLMKRDVSHVVQDYIKTTIDNKTGLPAEKQTPNVSATIKDLIHDVLLPLNNILEDRQKELDELIKMKDGLIKFIKSGKNYIPASDLNLTNIRTETSHNRNSYFSVYKLEIVPNFELDYKITNASILDRYMSKLKHDIYELIKDVVAIQRLHSDPSKVPRDIKFLINAMKQYVHKKGFHLKHRNKNETIQRRQTDDIKNNFDSSSIKDRIIKIIELLDKDIHKNNFFNTLSPVASKILKRLIKTYYTDEFAIAGLRVHDPHFNLTDDLNNVGLNWEQITKDLHTGTPTSQIYRMKTLYRVINADISKMADALSLIDFARTRRMMPIDQNVGEGIIKRITDDLYLVHEQIIRTNRLDPEIKQNPPLLIAPPTQKKKKESFIKQLKKILINSKRDIMSLLHKKVPKSDIVKELARKRLDTVTKERLSEYEDTMRRWQKQIKIAPYRKKREASGKTEVKRRMNNILPKYLRGKVPRNGIKPIKDQVRKALKPVRDSKVMAKIRETAPKKSTKSRKIAKAKMVKPKNKPKQTAVRITPHKINIVDRKKGVKTQNHRPTPKQTRKANVQKKSKTPYKKALAKKITKKITKKNTKSKKLTKKYRKAGYKH